MNGIERVVRRRVKRIKLEGAIADIDDVVPCAGGNQDGVVSVNDRFFAEIVFAFAREYLGKSALDSDELVCIGVHFRADLSADGYAHQSELHMGSRPKRCAEVWVHIDCVIYIEYQRFGAEITDFGMFAVVVIAHK